MQRAMLTQSFDDAALDRVEHGAGAYLLDPAATEPFGRESVEREPSPRQPAADLLPGVYAELRRLAAALSGELRSGQTLQATALVHEAYLRLVRGQDPGWEGRRHFFGAAARAMREILVEQARRKGAAKHGGGLARIELGDGLAVVAPTADRLLAVDEAVRRLEAARPGLAEVVLLRYYTGLSFEETAAVVGSSVSTVKRQWRFARAWLARALGEETLPVDAAEVIGAAGAHRSAR